MADSDMRAKIKIVAVDHFNRDGYHGATVRNIARDAGCSLPMVNYYFKSKQELFHEIIKQDYFELVERQAGGFRAGDLLESYTQFAFRLNHLSAHEKKVYRLGVKVYLGFDGDSELMDLMDQWEKSILPRHSKLVLPHIKEAKDGAVIVRALVHLLENLVESIVVKGRFLPEEEIREELSVVLTNIR